MHKSVGLFLTALFAFYSIEAQHTTNLQAGEWVDSVYRTLSKDERIAQLLILRSSAPPAPGTYSATFFDREIEEAIQKYNIGGICFFQGGPLQQASRINAYQSMARTPLLVTIDAEWGLGMRLDSVKPLPRALMMGAVQDADLMYAYGQLVGQQCKRAGFQMNYAPVMDINNNPDNPVINDRSFGEDKHRVALLGLRYMKGMQDAGIMTCAKHFPGHGDVAVDSHFDLPVIPKSKAGLDSLELYPFQQAIAAGVDAVMVAHLSVPAIDTSSRRATSISYPTITRLLRQEMGFSGLTFTDALEMKALTKYYPGGEISLQAVLAGNDLLCLPADVPGSIALIRKAIRKGKLQWPDIEARVRKILLAKYHSGLANWTPVPLKGITADLNKGVGDLTRKVAEQALTLLCNDRPALFPLAKGKRVAYVGVGIDKDNAFARRVRADYDAHVFYFDLRQSLEKAGQLVEYLKGQYDAVVIGLHNYSRRPGNNFGLTAAAIELVQQLQRQVPAITFDFGNPYALKFFCDAPVLIACYEDDPIIQETAADLLYGRLQAKGRLPVTICPDFPSGSGILASRLLQKAPVQALGFQPGKLQRIDSIVTDAIRQQAIPGAVVFVVKDGKIAYEKSFGHLTYDSTEVVYPETIYDLASVTKIMATTLSVMKLYDEGKLDLQQTLGSYLPLVKGSNKEGIRLWDVLLHQAGLKSFIPFYKETVDTALANIPLYQYYSRRYDSLHKVRVADQLYMRTDWVDSMYKRILTSEVGPAGKYIYSDNDFIFLGKVVEAVAGMPLDQYVSKTFYEPLQLGSIGFRPRERFPLDYIAPTEEELGFRQQLIHGDVHDPGAAMFGGVAGHAGLFSNAYDLAVLSEMLLKGGTLNGRPFFRKETIDYFSAYQSDTRRGLGFDKPERDNATRPEPYPARSASPLTFGHTGFTGTCVWIDPSRQLTFIMLSNRVHNNGDMNRFLKMNVRAKVFETVYQALEADPPTR